MHFGLTHFSGFLGLYISFQLKDLSLMPFLACKAQHHGTAPYGKVILLVMP